LVSSLNSLVKNYLTIRYNPSSINSKEKLVKNFIPKFSDPKSETTESLLEKNAKKFFSKSNEPIALSLSSGIDSSLSLSILRKLFPKRQLIGICAVFEGGNDESKQAKKIADQLNADFKKIKIDSIFRNMPELISIANQPRWNTYTHYVAKESKKYCNFYLTGDGADELFAGYTFRYKKFLTLTKPSDSWETNVKNYLQCHNRDWVNDQEHIFHKNMKFVWPEIYKIFKTYFHNRFEPITQVMMADFNGKLKFDFIPTSQKILKHYGLKGGSLFLDSNIINFALHLPTHEKYDSKTNIGKLHLRKITKKYGISHINEKKGFSPDLYLDWNKFGHKITNSILLESDCFIYKNNLINFDWVKNALEKIELDEDIRYLYRIVSILTLEIYFRLFKTKELSPEDKL